MEKESFESDAVAELMNKSFVNIKVDREERPDVDKVYVSLLTYLLHYFPIKGQCYLRNTTSEAY